MQQRGCADQGRFSFALYQSPTGCRGL